MLLAVAIVVAATTAGAAVDMGSGTEFQVTNNTTETPPPHENPDEASGEGDDEQVASYLADQLASRLGDSTREISEGQYEQGQAVLGDEYDDLLGQYVEVAGDTGHEDTAREFEETKADQEQLATELEEYEETRSEYEQAVADGDEERARELARELQSQAENVSKTADELDGHYASLDEGLPADFNESRQQITGIRENVTNESAAIRDAQLTGTTLNVTANRSTTSFTEPTELVGYLVTSDGEPVANRSINVRINERAYTVQTNDTGHFSLTYRPIALSLNATQAPVRFTPANASIYLRSETTIPLSVTSQTPSTTSITTSTDAAQFGDTVRANGTVSVANRTVAEVPVILTVDGQPLAAGETSADGSYSLTGTVPAAVENGSQSLDVAVALSNAAVTSSNASTTIQIAPTETNLDATANATNETVTLTGQLTTATGVPPGERQLTVTHDGRHLATIETTVNGSFTDTVSIPEAARDAEDLQLLVTFDGGGLNLAGAETTTTVPLSRTAGGASSSSPSLPTLPAVGAGLVTLLGLLAAVGWGVGTERIRAVLPAFVPFAHSASSSSATAAASSAEDQATTTSSAQPPQARKLLENAKAANTTGNTTAAVTTAYAAARSALQDRLSDQDLSSTTPREFATAIQDPLSDTTALHTLTRAFERATFAEASVDETTAHQAIETAETLIDPTRPTHDDNPTED